MQTKDIYSIYTKKNCPWGLKAIEMLKSHKLPYEIHILPTDQIQAFKKKYNVQTTPQIFLGDKRIGGYTELTKYLGVETENSMPQKSYTPVFAVFATTLLMGLSIGGDLNTFMGFFLCLLSLLKLMDLKSFQQSFRNYDLLTQKIPQYALIYPFLELFSGLGFLSGLFPIATGSIALFAGFLGAFSVFKAVFIEKKNLNCACVGAKHNVPLGFISLSENGVMAIMGFLILVKNFL